MSVAQDPSCDALWARELEDDPHSNGRSRARWILFDMGMKNDDLSWFFQDVADKLTNINRRLDVYLADGYLPGFHDSNALRYLAWTCWVGRYALTEVVRLHRPYFHVLPFVLYEVTVRRDAHSKTFCLNLGV